MPTLHDTQAMFYNHPSLLGDDSDNYSPTDDDTADHDNIPSYLEISSGIVKRYTPKPGNPRGGAIDTVGKTNSSCAAQ
ncbi:MAG TPA: hypothetical protein VFE27_07325 [Acidobacteriaceae bacterium]|nr:hypothetical protein [Acidobacteriaceae bacterium]